MVSVQPEQDNKKKLKYNNKKIEIDGHVFDSLKEGKRYMELKLLQKSGQIQDLKIQVPFILFEKNKYGNKMKYLADFVYMQNGETIVEDVKGFKTQVYKIKKRILAEKYNIIIKET